MRTQVNSTQAPATALPWRDDYWELISKRDGKADGKFYYSVRTTGVYCRPSCPARLAKRENVRFYKTCADAEQAGFRPCKRCRPDGISPAQQQAAKVALVCQI